MPCTIEMNQSLGKWGFGRVYFDKEWKLDSRKGLDCFEGQAGLVHHRGHVGALEFLC